MWELISGRKSALVLMVAIMVTVLLLIYLSQKKLPKLRELPQLRAIEEAVGRATEMNRPVHFTTGAGAALSSSSAGAMSSAGLSILGYVADLCAKSGTPLVTSFYHPDQLPLASDIIRLGYMRHGAMERFDRDYMVRYYGHVPSMVYTTGTCFTIAEEHCAANIYIGYVQADGIIVGETAAREGAIQVGGTANIRGIPSVVVCMDYTLIGEEVYAAGAYIAKDPAALGSLVAEDVYRVVAFVLMIVGYIFATAGITWITELLSY